ncbi:putative dehydrogenase [Prosthecobacter fusiformis]|uniref:Putative dehydrogenase n=1 Tax=Prosthecobacter fusiformis TaxID=48464 RepID=A0A4R7RYW9_9BACT|nr:Gfo/Idh/MocA family oxidoreductase [Prosthecobacter fusiformis]TDU71130.1 putative dehydrogenase [Prosthecobacter fusiformis]
MNQPTVFSRRHFLKTAGTSLFAAPFITSGLRAASPNGKLRHAAFGAGGMSWRDIVSLADHPMLELAAVCDVDTRQFDKIKKQFPKAKLYQDWREMLEKEGDSIDSVNVSTPDHMHAPMGLRSMDLGKHLYGQKPLAQTLHECRKLMLKAREKGVMTQMGIQASSDFTERYAVELVHLGLIGKVKEVHTFSNKKWGDMEPVPTSASPVPAELDWNMWLGPVTDRPYIEGYYHPKEWRKRRDFGTGTLGDMGCHMFSGWFRALELAAPIAVKSLGATPLNAVNWATDCVVEYTFKGTERTEKDTIKVTWYDGDARPPVAITSLVPEGKFPDQGSIYIGTEGVLLHQHTSTPMLYPREKFTGFRYPKLQPRNHWFDYVDCCLKGGSTRPTAHFDYAAPLTEAVLLGCIATVFPKENLTWDAEALKITNHEAAHGMVTRQYRPGWEI